MARINVIAAELQADPLTRGYAAMDDAAAAASLNAVDRPTDASLADVMTYLVLKSKDGCSLYGRIAVVAESAVGDSPLGAALTLAEVCAAKAIAAILAPGSSAVADALGPGMQSLIALMVSAGAIDTANGRAIKAMAENQRSRGREIGAGNVAVGHIAMARNLASN